ncbi:MAG: ABC transporter ATP-binding protein [Deltaproteobacteria bacterium]|nr:ABC transporter ATP-binding protein [Deltaproteobacteria bacterium]
MIRASNLTKLYGGRRALGPISFEIADGETVGFLGLNGAGKTTALRLLACDLRPSAGTIDVGGVDAIAEPHEVRKRIGFLPENPPLYMDMNVAEYLAYAGELRSMSKAEVKKRLPEVLEITDLKDVAYDVIGTLSHGYRQRVGVGQAIIHQPKFLILDEPTRGLDPVQIVEMRNLIHDLKQNHTVLISSHILTEISQTCDRLLVLGKGHMLAEGSEAELAGRKDDIQQITVLVRTGKAGDPYRGDLKDKAEGDKDKSDKENVDDSGKDAIKKLLAGVDGVSSVADLYTSPEGMSFSLATTKDCRAEVSRVIIDAKLDLLQLAFARSELESTFIRLVGGGTNAGN